METIELIEVDLDTVEVAELVVEAKESAEILEIFVLENELYAVGEAIEIVELEIATEFDVFKALTSVGGNLISALIIEVTDKILLEIELTGVGFAELKADCTLDPAFNEAELIALEMDEPAEAILVETEPEAKFIEEAVFIELESFVAELIAEALEAVFEKLAGTLVALEVACRLIAVELEEAVLATDDFDGPELELDTDTEGLEETKALLEFELEIFGEELN